MKIVVFGSLAESLINFRGALLDELVTRGHEVVAVAPNASEALIAELNKKSVRYRDIQISATGLNLFRDIKTLANLRRLFRDERPDIVLAYTIKPVVYGSIGLWLAGVGGKSFALVTGLGYAFTSPGVKARLAGFVARFLYAISCRLNEKVIFQNPDDQKLFVDLKLLRSKSDSAVVNGSGVDIEHFSLAALPPTAKFLLIARLNRDKGVFEYVEAARRLKSRYPEFVFMIAGWIDDNPASITQETLDSWKNSGEIEYLGKLADVRPAISESSIYVLPSYREGTPRTILEAMSMGRPVVTTDAPGCRETVVDGHNGFLIEVADVDSLYVAMEKLGTNTQLRAEMGSSARELVESKYEVGAVNHSILQVMGL